MDGRKKSEREGERGREEVKRDQENEGEKESREYTMCILMKTLHCNLQLILVKNNPTVYVCVCVCISIYMCVCHLQPLLSLKCLQMKSDQL